MSSTSIKRVASLTAAAALLIAAACERQNNAGMGPSGQREPSTAEPNSLGLVTLRIHPLGSYTVDGEGAPVATARLADRLRTRREGGATLKILSYRGATGYDVVLAVNAAREAGFTRVEGIADYDDSGSPESTSKRWVQDLTAGPPATFANDTPHRSR